MSSSIEETESETNNFGEQKMELKCYECYEMFIHSTHLSEHMKTEHNIDDAFQCPTCFHTFKKLSALTFHFKCKHTTKKDFACTECSEIFLKAVQFRSHMKDVHNQNNAFPCPHCTNFYKEIRHVNDHVRRVHENVRPFVCNLCPKSFQHNGNLQRHVNDIHNKEKNFLCHDCSKTFTQKKSLDFHIKRIHTLERPFKCDQCTLGFISTTTLKMHVLNKHSGKKSDEKNFMCHKCPAKFVAQSTLSTHLQTKACGRKVGGQLKNKNAKRSTTTTKKRIRSAKPNKSKICPKSEQQENVSLPSDTNPPSPEMIIVGVTPKEEYLDCPDTSCLILQDRVGESNSLDPNEVTMSEMVISQMDFSLKDRVFQIFRGQMKSGIMMLIGKEVLHSSDLTRIVMLAEEANLKTSEFIEAIIESYPNR